MLLIEQLGMDETFFTCLLNKSTQILAKPLVLYRITFIFLLLNTNLYHSFAIVVPQKIEEIYIMHVEFPEKLHKPFYRAPDSPSSI